MGVSNDTKNKSIAEIIRNPYSPEMKRKKDALDPKANVNLKKDKYLIEEEQRSSKRTNEENEIADAIKSDEEEVHLELFRKLDAEGTKLLYSLDVSMVKLQILNRMDNCNFLSANELKSACGMIDKIRKLIEDLKCKKTAYEVEVEYSIEITHKTATRQGCIAVIMNIEETLKDISKIDDPDLCAIIPKIQYLIVKYKLKI